MFYSCSFLSSLNPGKSWREEDLCEGNPTSTYIMHHKFFSLVFFIKLLQREPCTLTGDSVCSLFVFLAFFPSLCLALKNESSEDSKHVLLNHNTNSSSRFCSFALNRLESCSSQTKEPEITLLETSRCSVAV